jgi:tetratricopeptide (TPR) repeat protein
MVAGGLAISPGLRALVFGPPPPALVASLTPTVVVFPTLPAEWTATPTLDPLRATATPVPSRTPRATASPAQVGNLDEVVAGLQGQIDSAREHMVNRQFSDALQDWTIILSAAPDYAYAHDQRGEAYREWGDENATYLENVESALADYDAAVALDPNVGDYWLHRYYIFAWFGDNAVTSVDREYWYGLALASIQQANLLGNSDPASARLEGLALAELGECAAAETEFEDQLAAGPDESGGVNRGLALADACHNNYAAALTHINQALAVTNFENWQLEKIAILYQLGRYSEALTAANALVKANPRSCDCRLYLRAVVRYALGDTAGAEDDFELAQATGRDSEGLREYYLGRVAQAAGDTASAISYYQDSETALKVVYTGLRQELADRLNTLGSAPLDLSDIALASPTPIASRPVPQPSPLPPNLPRRPDDYIGEIIGQGGTGPFTLQPGAARDFQFQSVPPGSGEKLGFNVYLLGPEGVTDGADSGLVLRAWNQVVNLWAEYPLLWGGHQLADAVKTISNTYDVYSTVTNTSGAAVEVVNIQLYIDNANPP